MPPLAEGESLPLQEVELHQGKTSAPDYLSESELIGLMEKHGIGTDASISVHINNICERNYVSIQAGRKVVPTELGITLVRGYQLIDPELCRAQVCTCMDWRPVMLRQTQSTEAATCCGAGQQTELTSSVRQKLHIRQPQEAASPINVDRLKPGGKQDL